MLQDVQQRDYSTGAVLQSRTAYIQPEDTAVSGSNHTLNLVFAILVTIFCCLPLGIAAIVFSAMGMARQGSGDYTGAESAARTVRILNWISFGIGLAGIVIYLLAVLLLGIGAGFLF